MEKVHLFINSVCFVPLFLGHCIRVSSVRRDKAVEAAVGISALATGVDDGAVALTPMGVLRFEVGCLPFDSKPFRMVRDVSGGPNRGDVWRLRFGFKNGEFHKELCANSSSD